MTCVVYVLCKCVYMICTRVEYVRYTWCVRRMCCARVCGVYVRSVMWTCARDVC